MNESIKDGGKQESKEVRKAWLKEELADGRKDGRRKEGKVVEGRKNWQKEGKKKGRKGWQKEVVLNVVVQLIGVIPRFGHTPVSCGRINCTD